MMLVFWVSPWDFLAKFVRSDEPGQWAWPEIENNLKNLEQYNLIISMACLVSFIFLPVIPLFVQIDP